MILTHSGHVGHDLQDRSGTFADLMDLYERNYIGIRRLIPDLPEAGARRVSGVSDGLSLHLVLRGRFRYTTELSLTYYFTKPQGLVAEPDLRIRVYHDARLAEVVAAHLRRWPGFEIGEGDPGPLRARWRVNRFLYKWLSYCLHQGHCFGTRNLVD